MLLLVLWSVIVSVIVNVMECYCLCCGVLLLVLWSVIVSVVVCYC